MSRNTGFPSQQISLEPLQRRSVEQYTWDGQEIYEEKLSLSEQLSKNVQRLDFSRDLDLGLFQTEEERITEERDKTKNLAIGINQSKTEFLASKESLRKALTEISVLSDVLEIVHKCPNYLELKSVASMQGQTPLEVPHLPHKRATPGKSLMKARETLYRSADILLKGANDLKSCLGARNGSEHAFHDCLWSLREKWRLVRSQDCVMGDLTYHSAGARLQEKGRFLVRKSADSSRTATNSFCPVTLDIPEELLTRSALLVFLHSEPVRSSPNLDWNQMERDGWYGLSPPPHLPHWQRQLYKAQLTFFHQEMFSQLMIDAYSQQQVRPVYVCERQLHIQLRENKWLSLHCIQQSDKDETETNTSNKEPIPEPSRALYLFVCDALRQLHRQTENVPYPVPAPAQFAPLARRLDGPTASYLPASEESIAPTKGKHPATPLHATQPANTFEETNVLNKLQEAILQTDLLNFIQTTVRTVNMELKMCPIISELNLPADLLPSQFLVSIFEKHSFTDLLTLKLEPKTGTMHNIVPIGSEQSSIIFSIDSPKFLVYLRRTLLQNWTQKVVEFFSQDTDWLMTTFSPLQPCLLNIILTSSLSFLHIVSGRVVNVSLSYPDGFLISSGIESGYAMPDTFPIVQLSDCVGNSLLEKLQHFMVNLD